MPAGRRFGQLGDWGPLHIAVVHSDGGAFGADVPDAVQREGDSCRRAQLECGAKTDQQVAPRLATRLLAGEGHGELVLRLLHTAELLHCTWHNMYFLSLQVVCTPAVLSLFQACIRSIDHKRS